MAAQTVSTAVPSVIASVAEGLANHLCRKRLRVLFSPNIAVLCTLLCLLCVHYPNGHTHHQMYQAVNTSDDLQLHGAISGCAKGNRYSVCFLAFATPHLLLGLHRALRKKSVLCPFTHVPRIRVHLWMTMMVFAR